jgi:hypothetical protein
MPSPVIGIPVSGWIRDSRLDGQGKRSWALLADALRAGRIYE